ncbi:two-component sensor histidine kinase [Kroppenstedtia guangzhouensis]|uniref:histidine kinase n=1 Tax=Kroppenstedtia guangzhouensis TaxID=1274356 RepID=A0ABQ1GPG4_9BACL|nr:HAMP domain-containing sensor histidine kinase [Kroppenstedtia guangzhouensis]GGA47595.1 two-component sensor histidine kinase [Kroppenstedtia guangzhouensis]
MTLKARLTWRFLLWLILFLGGMFLLYFLVMISLFGINIPGGENPYIGDVMRNMKKATVVEGEQVRLSEEGIRELERLSAWLQILDDQGEEVYRRGGPRELPRRYSPGSLQDSVALSDLHTWHGSVKGKKLTWILGIEENSLVRRAAESAAIRGNRVQLPDPIREEIRRSGGWIQVLDETGREVESYRRPASHPDRLTAGEVREALSRKGRSGYRFHYWHDRRNGRDWTWLLAEPAVEEEPLMEAYDRIELTYFPLWALVTVIIAFLFGHRLGSPILHMMNWLKNLSNGKLQEPKDKRGRPASRSGEGRLRRPYRVYREVIQSLDSLTGSLKQAEEARSRLEKSREEWITGVSHDLKTPLSSIKGYADLLATDRFQWSEAEVRQFAGNIREKSEYMERLLEDLGLTFRLKNEALPLKPQPVDAAELLRRSAIDLANNPRFENREMVLDVPEERVTYPLDAAWFKRALDNLIANAAIHNPPETRIRLTLEIRGEKEGLSYPGLLFRVEDNGRGMDAESVTRLFDRYYRGTRTGSEQGTGLGMAIARQLVEAHGGEIRVESQPGSGTRVEVLLPPKS